MVTIDDISYQIIGAAMEVHTELGPGLNEKAYDACFGDRTDDARSAIRTPGSVSRSCAEDFGSQSTFRLDYVVRKAVIVEIKAVESSILSMWHNYFPI